MHKRLVLLTTLLVSTTAMAHAQLGPPGEMIYAHDVLYRTIGTPADLPPHGSFNAIYALGGGLGSVSSAAPGDREWRGGRWEVHLVTFLTIAPRQFTNAEDLLAARQRGEVAIGDVVRRFECPLIRAQER